MVKSVLYGIVSLVYGICRFSCALSSFFLLSDRPKPLTHEKEASRPKLLKAIRFDIYFNLYIGKQQKTTSWYSLVMALGKCRAKYLYSKMGS